MLRLWVLICKLFRRKSNFSFVLIYIMREGSRYAFLFDDLFAVTLCGTFFPVMHFIALLCWCFREASRKEGVPKNACCGAVRNMVFENWFLEKIESSWVFS